MNHCTRQELISFEQGVAAAWEAGQLPFLVHLSGGNELQLIELFKEIQPGDWVFSTHRNHYHYLLSGANPIKLEMLIRDGRSMFVFDKPRRHGCQVNFVSSSVLAGTCGIAAGVAWDIKNSKAEHRTSNIEHPTSNGGRGAPWVWCFLGDGAEDEGHFYEAMRFVDGHRLPCTFIIEDNDRSVDTTKAQRRSCWPGVDAAPMQFPPCVRRYYYVPTFPHAGDGCKHKIEFDAGVIAHYLEGAAL